MSGRNSRLQDLSQLPSVDRLIQHPVLQGLITTYSHTAVVHGAREALEQVRQSVQGGGVLPSLEEMVALTVERVRYRWQPTLIPLINATGVIIHTNLGRAPLSSAALAAMTEIARGYSNLEYNLERGDRGSRHSHVDRLLAGLTGAEAALVVNNNAAAVLLALSALAKGKEVIVSRGQAVEIGGGFRVPDVMRQSGAKLVEVGTTNRTRLSDYEAAITPRTAALLTVHTSNFRLIGFTESVELADLVALGQRYQLPVLNDLGSGTLLETTAYGLAHEPTAQEVVAAGVALATFSGDKLLGGPQAGLIVGRKELVERLRRHPLARAIRIDKLTLAALQATLLHYLRGEAEREIPIWQMITARRDELEARARVWVDVATAGGAVAAVADGESTVGGGSLPGEVLSSRVVRITGPAGGDRGRKRPGAWLAEVGRRLRLGTPGVVARIEDDALILDPRTVLPAQDQWVAQALAAALAG